MNTVTASFKATVRRMTEMFHKKWPECLSERKPRCQP